jgi:hypothetical protein
MLALQKREKVNPWSFYEHGMPQKPAVHGGSIIVLVDGPVKVKAGTARTGPQRAGRADFDMAEGSVPRPRDRHLLRREKRSAG